jgi:signal transduction histidine kinase
MPTLPEAQQPDFLKDGGELGALIRAFDWARHPLGRPENWPQPLRTAIRLLLNTGHPMYIWWGPELFCFYNDAYRQSIGAERHPGSLGQPGREVWAEIWDIIGPQIEQVMGGGGATWHENALVPITRDGRREDVYWTYSYGPIDDSLAVSGVGGVLVVCTETTAIVRGEMRRAQQMARQRRLFEQAPAFIILMRGPEHVVSFLNDAHRVVFNSDDWLGRPIRAAFPSIKGQGFFEKLDVVYATGEPFEARDAAVRFRRTPSSAEEIHYFNFTYAPLLDENGVIDGISCVGFDVTETHEVNEKLQDADRRKDEFIATLAHELRNPLAPIRNALQIARSQNSTEAQRRWSLEVIDRQAGNMALLLDDLLDVSRITRGTLQLRLEAVELAAVIDTAIETARPLMDARKHRLTVDLPQKPLRLFADALRLAQAVSNLLTNAAKYSEPGGEIRLDVMLDASDTRIRVADQGIGIEPHMLTRIFEMFAQGTTADDHVEGGLGIGLSLVKGLVELHGGVVDAASDGPGKGSVFTIRLPLPRGLAGGVGDTHTPVNPTGATGKRILVVDDNRDITETLSLLLQLEGHDTRIAYDGKEAMEVAEVFQPEIVVLDIGMPHLNGHATASRLRKRPWAKNTVFVAVTGWGQPADRHRSAAAGFHHHLVKPVALSALRVVLQRNS